MALIVAVALVLRLAVTQLPNFENLMDADHMHAWEPGNVAEALLAGRGFGSALMSNQVSAIMPPVYPLVVAVLFKLFGIHTAASIFAAHVLNCAISALSCIPVFLIARRSFGTRAAWWSAWAWAFSPYGIYFAASWAWSTHLLLACLLWLIWLGQKMEGSSRLGLWAGFGALAGFAGLTEPSILVVVPFLMALACWRLWRSDQRWLVPATAAGLALAATLSPWMIRNAAVFHRFIPMRDSMGLELWMGNNGHNLRWTSDDLHPLHDAEELADYERMGELAYMDHKDQQAKAFIRDHKEWYVWMCARRAVYLWTSYWSFDRSYLAEEPADPFNIPFATALSLLSLLGVVAARRSRSFEALRYGGVLLLFPFMYYFTHPEPYHMRPLDPLMLLLGCFAFLDWREWARARVALPAEVAL